MVLYLALGVKIIFIEAIKVDDVSKIVIKLP